MAVSAKPKVLIGVELRFPRSSGGYENETEFEFCEPDDPNCGGGFSRGCGGPSSEVYANISIETGGYVHNRDLSPAQPIGQIECSIGRVIHSGGTFHKTLEYGTKSVADSVGDAATNSSFKKSPKFPFPPEVTIIVEEDLTSRENIELKIRGFGLAKTEIFGKTDPYLTIFRSNNRGSRYIQCYRTDVLRNTQNPDWKTITVSYERLCNNNLDSDLCIRVYCGDGTLTETEEVDIICDQLVGEIKVTARELITTTMLEERKFELINPKKKKKKKSYVNSGLICIKAQKCHSEPTFLDFMFQGLELNFIVAIDLTLSNGDSSCPESLHFVDSATTNEYSIAIQAVLEILQEYDNDELFPAFGFGARVPPEYKICHEYPLNGNFEYPYCYGAEGVIRAYQETLKVVKLAGPTCFAPVIRYVSRIAKTSESGKHYFVLLILTDGTVDDWMETKKAVIETSYLPVSIIVVGVGGGKFSDMEILDQDFGLLTVTSEKACRDNVQFVKMRRYLRAAADGSHNIKWGKVALAKDVLAELPYQVVEYMHRRAQLTQFLDSMSSNHRGVATSVFSSCLFRHSSSPEVEPSRQQQPFSFSSRRVPSTTASESASTSTSPVSSTSTSISPVAAAAATFSAPQRLVSAQARARLLKNNRQFSVDSSVLSSKQQYSRKTPPFSRKSNFS